MKKWQCITLSLLLIAMLAGLVGCSLFDNTDFDFTADYKNQKQGAVSSGVSVHDPSIIKVGDTYYIYGSHMAAAKSDDLKSWKKVADGYGAANPVFGQIYSVKNEAFAYAGDRSSLIETDDGGTHVWAPDIIYNENDGLYYMYYCTTSTWVASNLCYGTSKTPEGPFEWQGALLYSGFTMDNIDATDVLDYVSRSYAEENYIKGVNYNYKDFPNAIDPSVFYDEDGRLWMTYGSWSGGIFLIELDPVTGKCIHPEADEANNVDPYFGKRLIGGGHKSIEGPYILYDEASGYYYLFVSYGALNRTGGYQIRVYRSETVNGEYVDMNGQFATKGSAHSLFGLKLSGNYMLPSLPKAYMATGHNSAFVDDDGRKYIVYHTRFDGGSEYHSPRVHQFLVNAEGWPCMLPYQTQGEVVTETGYDKEDIVGRYYMINQGIEINDSIATPIVIYLQKSGKVVGAKVEGKWEYTEGTYYMTITIDETEYSGVFCRMPDEAGTEVMTFSAVGNNRSVWGVKYDAE